MITDKDYSYVDNSTTHDSQSNISEIRIDADNAWHGVQLKYGRVSAQVLENRDMAQLSFEFNVTNQDEDVTKELENDTEFQTYIGDILTHIISSAFDNGDYRIGRDDDTDDDTTESAAR
jgi:hypothetical protein